MLHGDVVGEDKTDREEKKRKGERKEYYEKLSL
jgi:hypothetical protein